MNIKNIFLALLFSLVAIPAFCQSYEEIYAISNDEVRARIDQNKMQGVEMLSSIYSSHSIGFVGVGLTKKEELERIILKQKGIISCLFNEDNTHVLIHSSTLFSKSTFESILEDFDAKITGYSVQYTVKD